MKSASQSQCITRVFREKSILGIAEQYMADRARTAAESWLGYEILHEDAQEIHLRTPERPDVITGQMVAHVYVLSRGRCSCCDQSRLDRVNKMLVRHFPGADPVLCKHWHIAAILRLRKQEQQEALEQAIEADRIRRMTAAIERVPSWRVATLQGTIWDDQERWRWFSPGRSDDGYRSEASARRAAEEMGLVVGTVERFDWRTKK